VGISAARISSEMRNRLWKEDDLLLAMHISDGKRFLDDELMPNGGIAGDEDVARGMTLAQETNEADIGLNDDCDDKHMTDTGDDVDSNEEDRELCHEDSDVDWNVDVGIHDEHITGNLDGGDEDEGRDINHVEDVDLDDVCDEGQVAGNLDGVDNNEKGIGVCLEHADIDGSVGVDDEHIT